MIYDLDKLIEGKRCILDNIKAFEEALVAEKQKLEEYDRHIKDAQEILKQHGVDGNGQEKG